MSDYEVIDEELVLMLAPIDKPKDADTQVFEEFWSDPCWSEKD